MKNIITMLATIIGFAFAQEMEVDGVLRVTGGINADGQPITNVGNPTQDNDAVNLSTVRDMSGMKPERIYTYNSTDGIFSFTVPENKFWMLYPTPDIPLSVNSNYVTIQTGVGIVVLPGQSIQNVQTGSVLLNIYEYPISGSGTDQGMNYVEP